MATNEYAGNRLQHLKDSDYEVADGQPDIRGWDVKDTAGKTIGKVKELIFDTTSLKVRYMVVDTSKNDFDLDDHKVLILIGLAELHEKGDDVILPGVTAAQLEALPEYKDNITSDDEYQIRNVFAGAGAMGLGAAALTPTDGDFYDHQHFNEANLNKKRTSPVVNEDAAGTSIPIIEENLEVDKRTVQTGGAYIKSRIVEKPVEETITLQEEKVHVERTPVDRKAENNDFDTFKEGVIELTEHAEVPVVNKQACVVEEIKVNKEVAERTETVRDTVRKTEVDVQQLDSDNNTGNTYKSDSPRGI